MIGAFWKLPFRYAPWGLYAKIVLFGRESYAGHCEDLFLRRRLMQTLWRFLLYPKLCKKRKREKFSSKSSFCC